LPQVIAGYREGVTSTDLLILWKRVDEVRSRMTPDYYHPRYARVIDDLRDSGLQIRRLDELAPYTAYGQVGRREYDEHGEVQLLNIRNHEPTGIDFWEERRFVARGSYNDPARTRLRKRDILLSNSGVRAIGRATLVTELPTPANVTQHVQVIRPDDGTCAEALVVFLQSQYGQLQIEQRTTGVAASGLTYEDINSILVPNFRDQEADAIAGRYSEMDRHHRAAQRARRQIAEGSGSAATERRFERERAKAAELLGQLIADMEETIRTGIFSF
jgi:hypothetical protein